ncbi:MAG: DUF1566 domain-containing protein, partial [Rhodoferax sp.]|nr:DUF1566 domain-containing protein [Rhodoferax sp.]
MESLAPVQPVNDTGGAPAILDFQSTDKTALFSFTKYMNMKDVENLLRLSPKQAGTATPAVFPVWAYQNLHLVYDSSSGGLALGATKGLPVGGGSFGIAASDNLPDAYNNFAILKDKISYTVTEKQNGVYGLPDPVGLEITTQPSAQTAIAGQSATFSVAASGTGTISYQWKKNGIDIAGATSSSYTTPATKATDDNAVFAVVVKNGSGSTLASSNAALAVVAPPAIATQPSAQAVTPGQSATFSVSATGAAPLRYQWAINGTDISGATSSSYTIAATSLADNGAVFSVVVSNSVGAVTSSNATLTVSASATGYSLVANAAGGFYDKTECVKDNRTGLVWEGKPTSGTRSWANYYTNYDSTASAQKWNGSAYVNPTQAEIDASTNSIGYKNWVNTGALCGYTDWRLPTKEELQGILANSGSPMIDTTW